MNLTGLLHEAWVSIGTHRLRTFLAVLGIVIGVASVVVMMAIGAGSRRAVEESIEKLGTNLLTVTPGNFSNRGMVTLDPDSLTTKHADMIAGLPSVAEAAPATMPNDVQVVGGNTNWKTRLSGTTANFFTIRNWSFAEGDAFTESDVQTAKRVVVLGATTAEKLFPGESAAGRAVRINNISFLVVGVLAPKGSDFSGRDQDDAIYAPLTTAKNRVFGDENFFASMISYIYVQAVAKEAIGQATEEITALLRQQHRLKPTEDDDFTIRNMSSVTRLASETTQALSMLLGAVASISLVVGGIGIANIMLVNVTERTREIGIRKAIGASERQILLQFLFEAMLIAASGSLLGLALGFGGGIAVSKLLAIATEFNLWSVILALVVAAGIGVASGFYPALKAARMQPIEALRAIGA